MFALMPLRMEQSTKLIESSLKLYRKTLTQDQMQGVLAKHKSDNPLYLRLFCEVLTTVLAQCDDKALIMFLRRVLCAGTAAAWSLRDGRRRGRHEN